MINSEEYYLFLMRDIEDQDPIFTRWAFSKNVTYFRDEDEITFVASRSLKRSYCYFLKHDSNSKEAEEMLYSPTTLLELLLELIYPYTYNSITAPAGEIFNRDKNPSRYFWKLASALGFLEADRSDWNKKLLEFLHGEAFGPVSKTYSIRGQIYLYFNDLGPEWSRIKNKDIIRLLLKEDFDYEV